MLVHKLRRISIPIGFEIIYVFDDGRNVRRGKLVIPDLGLSRLDELAYFIDSISHMFPCSKEYWRKLLDSLCRSDRSDPRFRRASEALSLAAMVLRA